MGYRLDYLPLFGKRARAPPPESLFTGRKDWTRESCGNWAYMGCDGGEVLFSGIFPEVIRWLPSVYFVLLLTGRHRHHLREPCTCTPCSARCLRETSCKTSWLFLVIVNHGAIHLLHRHSQHRFFCISGRCSWAWPMNRLWRVKDQQDIQSVCWALSIAWISGVSSGRLSNQHDQKRWLKFRRLTYNCHNYNSGRLEVLTYKPREHHHSFGCKQAIVSVLHDNWSSVFDTRFLQGLAKEFAIEDAFHVSMKSL